MASHNLPNRQDGKGKPFATTHWSIVLAAGKGSSKIAEEALENLCSTYWPPLYAYARRSGHPPHQAEDLVQTFFLHLLTTEALRTVAQTKGKFRSFLLVSLGNFLKNEYDKQHTQKRGARKIISLQPEEAEALFGLELQDNITPEALFERRWALVLIEQVLLRLRREYESKGNVALYETLHAGLTNQPDPEFYKVAAAKLGMTESTLRVAVHRMRRRFGELLRSQIAYTVTSPQQVEEEIRHLFAAISINP